MDLKKIKLDEIRKLLISLGDDEWYEIQKWVAGKAPVCPTCVKHKCPLCRDTGRVGPYNNSCPNCTDLPF